MRRTITIEYDDGYVRPASIAEQLMYVIDADGYLNHNVTAITYPYTDGHKHRIGRGSPIEADKQSQYPYRTWKSECNDC